MAQNGDACTAHGWRAGMRLRGCTTAALTRLSVLDGLSRRRLSRDRGLAAHTQIVSPARLPRRDVATRPRQIQVLA